MFICTRKIHFDAGHRIVNHDSQCKYLHGHRYVIEASFTAKELDNLGMVIDFGCIDKILGNWINDNWDHNLILWEKDKDLGDNVANITNQKIYYLPYNPTAENIGKYLLENICPKLFVDEAVNCTSVIVNETPNCYVKVSL